MSETNFKKQSRNTKPKKLSNNHKTECKNQSDITNIKEDNRTNKPITSCLDSKNDKKNPAYEVNNSSNHKKSYLATSNHIRNQNTDHKNSDIKSTKAFKNSSCNSNKNDNKNDSYPKKYKNNNERLQISVDNSLTVVNSKSKLVTSESNSGNFATESTTSADCDKDNKDILKMSWKMKRLKEQEEKRIRREESIRRERIAPKSEHFKVIDSMTFKDFINADNTKNKTFRNQDGSDGRTNNEFKLTQSLCLEFPDLNSASNYNSTKNRNKFSNNFKNVVQNSSVNRNFRNYDSGEFRHNNFSSETIISKNNELVIPESSTPSGETSRKIKSIQKVSNAKKKVRKTDLIEFNIGNVLEMIQQKQKNNTKLVNTSVISKKKQLSKRSSLLVGNKLDADNPVRKRGKYRENKKRKLTRMKRLIVNERQIRMFLKNEAKEFLEKNQRLDIDHSFDSNVISNVDKYINYDKPKLNEQNLSENNSTIASLSSINDNNETEENGADHENNNNLVPKMLIHSRKFRYYCNQWPNKEMSNYVNELIKSIVRFQDRHHDNDPIKARAKRRYVCGFHEVFKFTQINKPKLIIIATDMECVKGEGGLLDYISQLTTLAEKFNIPYVFSGTRWSLKSSFRKKCPISVAAILNYDGAEDLYKNVIRMLPEVKSLYLENLKEAEKKCGINHEQVIQTKQQEEEDVTSACIQSLLNKLSFNDDKVHHKNTSTEDSSDDFDDDNNKFSSNINSVNDNNCPFMSAILKFS